MRDLVIHGMGSVSGGEYGEIKVNGHGKIDGDLSCKQMNVNGTAQINGNIKSDYIRISGAAYIHGKVEGNELRIDGQANLSEGIKCKEIKIYGSLNMKGNLAGETVLIKGHASIQNDCEAEEFTAKGAFSIGGLINADRIDITLYGNSRAKEIGGESINVQKQHRFLFDKFLKPNRLEVDIIEGDEIEIEFTTAKVVRGNKVIIGKGCQIGLVEYKEHCSIDKDAKVEEQKKI